jgi:hypothetical protein
MNRRGEVNGSFKASKNGLEYTRLGLGGGKAKPTKSAKAVYA